MEKKEEKKKSTKKNAHNKRTACPPAYPSTPTAFTPSAAPLMFRETHRVIASVLTLIVLEMHTFVATIQKCRNQLLHINIILILYEQLDEYWYIYKYKVNIFLWGLFYAPHEFCEQYLSPELKIAALPLCC